MGKKTASRRTKGTGDAAAAPGMAPPAGQKESRLEALVAETVALFHRLRIVAEQIHRQGESTAGKRGILVGLDRFGPQTVPRMARARPVSRQYVQALVNQLLAEGLVEQAENPAHRRSHLIRLTAQGKALVDAMTRRERGLLSRLRPGVADGDLCIAARAIVRDGKASSGDRRGGLATW